MYLTFATSFGSNLPCWQRNFRLSILLSISGLTNHCCNHDVGTASKSSVSESTGNIVMHETISSYCVRPFSTESSCPTKNNNTKISQIFSKNGRVDCRKIVSDNLHLIFSFLQSNFRTVRYFAQRSSPSAMVTSTRNLTASSLTKPDRLQYACRPTYKRSSIDTNLLVDFSGSYSFLRLKIRKYS